MIPTKVIELAIEGGWHDHYDAQGKDIDLAVLDPLFWQALGKKLGWEKLHIPYVAYDDTSLPTWLLIAKRFFECLMTNGDTAAFWAALLNKE